MRLNQRGAAVFIVAGVVGAFFMFGLIVNMLSQHAHYAYERAKTHEKHHRECDHD